MIARWGMRQKASCLRASGEPTLDCPWTVAGRIDPQIPYRPSRDQPHGIAPLRLVSIDPHFDRAIIKNRRHRARSNGVPLQPSGRRRRRVRRVRPGDRHTVPIDPDLAPDDFVQLSSTLGQGRSTDREEGRRDSGSSRMSRIRLALHCRRKPSSVARRRRPVDALSRRRGGLSFIEFKGRRVLRNGR